jgi:hypothetical protein
MKRVLAMILALILGIGMLAVVAAVLLRPWMDRWGASPAELAAALPGDNLVPAPATGYTRAITIEAPPQAVFPWLLQLGADRAGLYSYTLIERLIMCPMVNADRIHPEWQGLQVGDLVKMCPGDFGPLPFAVALIEPDKAIVLGHQNADESWSDIWQFVLLPQEDGSSRLILRSRDMLTGGIWEVIRPGVFIMTRGMLLGIKSRAEGQG